MGDRAPLTFPQFTPTFRHASYPSIDPTLSAHSAVGKTILITGGGTGIGRTTALAFASAGAKAVIIIDRTEQTLITASNLISFNYPNTIVSYFVAEALDERRIEQIFWNVRDDYGSIDVVIDNRGFLSSECSVRGDGVEEWFKSFEVNTKGSYIITKAFLKYAEKGATLIGTNTGTVGLHIPKCNPDASSKIAAARVLEDAQIVHPEFRMFNLLVCFHKEKLVPASLNLRRHLGVGATEVTTKRGVRILDDESLPANFAVWLASSVSPDFLKGRFLWCNWDIDELKDMETEIVEKDLLKVGVSGYPQSDGKSQR